MWGVGCARLRRAGEGAGAGERAERGGAERGEGTGQREGRERDSIADGTALRCGRVGSRHFRESSFRDSLSFVAMLPTLLLIGVPENF